MFFARICRASQLLEVSQVEYEADMNVICALQKIAESPGSPPRAGRCRAGRLGMQLPGGGLRVVYDGHQRPRAAGLHGPHR